MLAIAYYLLKVTICSGILYGYYRIALHNKVFHRWNRFYLLFAVVISLSLPFIRINIGHTSGENENQVVRLLNIVTTGDEYVYNISHSSGFYLTGEQVAGVIYMTVSAIFLVLLLHTLIKLNRLMRSNPLQKIQRIKVVQTDAKGTPFSFFRYIFWNRNMDMHSAAGEKIFMHEMVHVTERHSADRLFMNTVLIFFWCNPFFWLIRQEINMIHEFIADKKTIEDKDTSVFASMILHAVYPEQAFGLTSNFFSSSIKRRLHMLTKIQNPVLNYVSRLLVLPLLTLIFVAFTLKTKQLLPGQNETPAVQLESPITVVIDAGHGGDDAGAKSRNGLLEKNITLEIARSVKNLNNNSNIHILLTRDKDVNMSVKEKIAFAVRQHPDALIAIHVNAAPPGIKENRSGIEIYLSNKPGEYSRESHLLASLIGEEIQPTYGSLPTVKTRTSPKGTWMLDAPEIKFPALIIECGYITNKEDLLFISNKENQEKIAQNILRAIERFAEVKTEDKTIY